jgi:hypothetical protein
MVRAVPYMQVVRGNLYFFDYDVIVGFLKNTVERIILIFLNNKNILYE